MSRFTDLYGNAFKKYADFSGRACRAEACAFLLTNAVLQTVVGYLAAFLFFGGVAAESGGLTIVGGLLYLVIVVFGLATMVPSWALGARRLHDVNQSGWLQLLYLLMWIPFVNFVIAVGFIVVFYCIPGTEGDNNYGPVSDKY